MNGTKGVLNHKFIFSNNCIISHNTHNSPRDSSYLKNSHDVCSIQQASVPILTLAMTLALDSSCIHDLSSSIHSCCSLACLRHHDPCLIAIACIDGLIAWSEKDGAISRGKEERILALGVLEREPTWHYEGFGSQHT